MRGKKVVDNYFNGASYIKAFKKLRALIFAKNRATCPNCQENIEKI